VQRRGRRLGTESALQAKFLPPELLASSLRLLNLRPTAKRCAKYEMESSIREEDPCTRKSEPGVHQQRNPSKRLTNWQKRLPWQKFAASRSGGSLLPLILGDAAMKIRDTF
jgi:hypothetical protein